jgi:hypothetical protein
VKHAKWAVGAAAMICALTSAGARAQTSSTSGFAIDRFEPAAGGSGARTPGATFLTLAIVFAVAFARRRRRAETSARAGG